MKLHIVGGFLGSGKTTAIIHAAQHLMAQGQRVGVITNDQGKYLVDTAFFRLTDIPAVEVTGGCFCCHYDDLDDRLNQLIAEHQPDVIFAESVGSCADIVATVVKPLLTLFNSALRPSSFSVFADARLLRRRLAGMEMPFSEDVVYIFDKQIEEAGLVVINKTDLLGASACAEVREAFAQRYPEKPYLLQSSLQLEGVTGWVKHVQSEALHVPLAPLEIDYVRYGSGEARLAWLDEEIRVELDGQSARGVAVRIIEIIVEQLRQRNLSIGHLKFILRARSGEAKVSIPTLEEPGWQAQIPALEGDTLNLLVNARVEMSVDALRDVLHQALVKSGCAFHVGAQEAFHPGFPNPTHRLS